MPVTADSHFFLDGDGELHETAVWESVLKLKEMFPSVDVASFEAELMLERTHRVIGNDRDGHWGQYGLTGIRVILLRLLYAAESRRMTMGDIATRMNLGPNNVTQLVDALAERGLVERIAGEDDKRVVYATLTARGRELFALVLPQNARRIEQAWAPLSEREKKTLRHLLARVRMNLLARDASMADDHPVEPDHSRTRRGRS